jgi:hypothetical protein
MDLNGLNATSAATSGMEMKMEQDFIVGQQISTRVANEAETIAQAYWDNAADSEITFIANNFNYCTNDLLDISFDRLPERIAHYLLALATNPEGLPQAIADDLSTDDRKFVVADGVLLEDICAACGKNIRQCKCGGHGRRSRVRTSYINPPIPIRCFDWVAWIDGEEEGHRGHGKTEQEAIDELSALLSQYDAEQYIGMDPMNYEG